MGEEKQFGAVNGSDGSAGKVHGWSKSDFTSNGNLVCLDRDRVNIPVVNESFRR